MEKTELSLLAEALNSESPERQVGAMNTIIGTIKETLGEHISFDRLSVHETSFRSVYKKGRDKSCLIYSSDKELILTSLCLEYPATDLYPSGKMETVWFEVENIFTLTMLAVKSLETAPDAYFIAERLPALGSILIAPLENIVKTSNRTDAKTLAALVLLNLGSQRGVTWLRTIIDQRDKYSSWAASLLVAKGVREVENNILNYLRTCDLQQEHEIITMISALEKLEIRLPEDIYQKLHIPEAPFGVKFVLAQHLQRV